jgi:hypothetical protein
MERRSQVGIKPISAGASRAPKITNAQPKSTQRNAREVIAITAAVLIASIIIGVLATQFGGTPHAKEVNIFSDNFEPYTVGNFPSSGGWEMVYNGMGDAYQVISDVYSYSPPKSFQLQGQPWWSAVVQKRITIDAKIIGYEASILIDSLGTLDSWTSSDWFGFFNSSATTWGEWWATVGFDHRDMKIKAGSDSTVLGDWATQRWYKIKVILDREKITYDVWINDTLVGQNLKTDTGPYAINAIALKSDHPGSKVYYDDVKVFRA